MAADPSSFDYYRRGQPLNVEKGRPDNSGFDYYRRGQPLIGLVDASTYTLTASTGVFTLTGNAAGLTVARKITASTGSFTLTGNAASLIVSRVLTAATGVFVLTGNNANLLVTKVLSAQTGVFLLTGNDANLTFVAFYFIRADTGTFLLTGNDAILTAIQPTPTDDQSGDGFRLSERYKIQGEQRDERQFQLLEEEQDIVFDFIKAFIISNN